MEKRLLKIITIIVYFLLIYNNICYADVLPTPSIIDIGSLLFPIGLVVLITSLGSIIMLKYINKEKTYKKIGNINGNEEKVIKNEEQIKINKKKFFIAIILTLLGLDCFLGMISFFSFYSIPPVIISIILLILYKKKSKKVKILYVIDIIVIIIVMILHIHMINKWIEGRMENEKYMVESSY